MGQGFKAPGTCPCPVPPLRRPSPLMGLKIIFTLISKALLFCPRVLPEHDRTELPGHEHTTGHDWITIGHDRSQLDTTGKNQAFRR